MCVDCGNVEDDGRIKTKPQLDSPLAGTMVLQPLVKTELDASILAPQAQQNSKPIFILFLKI